MTAPIQIGDWVRPLGQCEVGRVRAFYLRDGAVESVLVAMPDSKIYKFAPSRLRKLPLATDTEPPLDAA